MPNGIANGRRLYTASEMSNMLQRGEVRANNYSFDQREGRYFINSDPPVVESTGSGHLVVTNNVLSRIRLECGTTYSIPDAYNERTYYAFFVGASHEQMIAYMRDTRNDKSWFVIRAKMKHGDASKIVVGILPVPTSGASSLRNATSSMHIASFEIDTPQVDNYNSLMRAIIDAAVEFVTQPVKPGCVAAYLDTTKSFWLSLRRDNSALVCFDGDYYVSECIRGEIVNVRSADGTTYQVLRSNLNVYRGDFMAAPLDAIFEVYLPEIAGEPMYVERGMLTPIYQNAIPFDSVWSYLPTDVVEEQYESVMVGSERRFINMQRPAVALFSQGIQPYSTRIEQIMPADKMFVMGKVDLYSRRDRDEVPFLGWELEACCNEATVDGNTVAKVFKKQLPFMVMTKSDSSISPAGFETVSVPATLDAWKESDIEAALDVMRSAPYNMRSFEHGSCGFHVHVSRSALSVLDLQKMERFMHNPANREFLEKIAGRGACTYANFNEGLFNNRTDTSSIAAAGAPNSTYDTLRWFNTSDTVLSLLNTNHYDPTPREFYDFLSNSIAFSSMTSVLHPIRMHLDHIYSCDDWASVSAAARESIMAFAALGPITNAVVRFFWSALDVPVIERGGPASTTNFDFRTEPRKSKLKASRKANFENCHAFTKSVLGKGGQRYDVLNTRNQNTVEFRLFKGTMNPNSVMRYLEFVDALVRFVAYTTATNDGVNYTTFIKWIIDDPFNVSRYENIVTFLVEQNYIERQKIRRKELLKLTDGDGSPNPGVTPKTSVDGMERPQPLFVITPTGEAVPEQVTPLFEESWDDIVADSDPDYEEPDFDDAEFFTVRFVN